MALETGNYPADLVVTNPDGADSRTTADDHLRLLKKTIKNAFAGFAGGVVVTGTDGGSANAYTVTPTNALPSYTSRLSVIFSPTAANTGAATINVSGLGAKDIKRIDGSALVAGDLASGSIYAAIYNGTEFRLMAPTKNYIDQLSLGTAYPTSPGDAGRFLQSTGTTLQWAFAGINGYAAKNSSYTLAATDKEKLIDCTGTFTLSFTAAATLGSSWATYIRNGGTGDITFDPNGSETIDGMTSFVMYPGEARIVFCDGTSFYSVVLTPFLKTFTSSGTFTKPPGYGAFRGLAWSGGASGQRSGGSSLAVGGGGGGCGEFFFLTSGLSATETVTIGAGGAAVTTAAAGNVGGNTSLGTRFTVYANTTAAGGGAIGVGAAMVGSNVKGFEGGQDNTTAQNAVWGGGSASTNVSTDSGGSIYGGGAGGGVDGAGTIRSAGTSKVGGSGGAAGNSTNGADGTAPGGGGGATRTGTASGAGARGELRIWGIC